MRQFIRISQLFAKKVPAITYIPEEPKLHTQRERERGEEKIIAIKINKTGNKFSQTLAIDQSINWSLLVYFFLVRFQPKPQTPLSHLITLLPNANTTNRQHHQFGNHNSAITTATRRQYHHSSEKSPRPVGGLAWLLNFILFLYSSCWCFILTLK